MASKDSAELGINERYPLGDYSFRIERSSVPGSTNDKIEAICTKGGKNARKSIQVPSSTQIFGWYVEANETEASVYIISTVKTDKLKQGSLPIISAAGTYLGSTSGDGKRTYYKTDNGEAYAWFDTSGTCGPELLATKSGSVQYTNNISTASNTIDGVTWYASYGYHGRPPYDTGGLPGLGEGAPFSDGELRSFMEQFGLGLEEEEKDIIVGRFAIEIDDAGGVGPGGGTGGGWTDPEDYDEDWEEGDPTHTLYVEVTGALSGRHNDPIVDPSFSYIPADKDTVKDYGCGGDGGHGGGGGAGASTVVIHKFATNQANSKEVTAIARRHGYGSGGGKGGKGGDGCILVYY